MALVPVTPSSLKKLQPGGKVLYYTCPMPEHAIVHEDKPGKCPLCAMTLIPVMATPKPAVPSPDKTAEQYFCPMHPNIVSNAPGKCPECQMDLVLKNPATN
jgi:Cu2+-exporting ATPase